MALILVIDDNRDNLDPKNYLPCAFGHDSLTASDGVAGLALARREQPDLVVSDIHMPGTDGYAILRAIRGDAALHEIPVPPAIALTMRGDREHGLRAGFDGYLAKPLDPQTFVEQIEGFLPPDRRGCLPPRRETAADATPAERAALPPIGKVLVVDDSASNRELVCQILQPMGYEVRAAAGVRHALRMAQESVPDLVITTCTCPEKTASIWFAT